MGQRGLGMGFFLALMASAAWAQNNKTRANSYDDGWETGWVNHCRTVFQGGSGKTTGFVLHVGDSITHSNPYSQWPRAGAGGGPTAEDTAIITWFGGAAAFPGSNTDATSSNGLYLAVADTENNADGSRGMTSASGLRTDEFLSGTNNGTTAMPTDATQSSARTVVSSSNDPTPVYGGNLNATTMAAAFGNAQIAVLMLGTNDATAGRTQAAFIADLTAIVNTLEAKNIVVILSTIPPHPTQGALAQSYNSAIATFASTRGLPLIDYHAEIVARGTTGLMNASPDPHPTASGGAYTSASNPYTPGGDPTTHTTGDACLNSGYLLRSWLTVQKLKEVQSYVVNGVNPPSPSPSPSPTPPAVSNGRDNDNGDQCGCGSVAWGGHPALLYGAALLSLAFLAGRRIK